MLEIGEKNLSWLQKLLLKMIEHLWAHFKTGKSKLFENRVRFGAVEMSEPTILPAFFDPL